MKNKQPNTGADQFRWWRVDLENGNSVHRFCTAAEVQRFVSKRASAMGLELDRYRITDEGADLLCPGAQIRVAPQERLAGEPNGGA